MLQLDEEFKLLEGVNRVVDLCAGHPRPDPRPRPRPDPRSNLAVCFSSVSSLSSSLSPVSLPRTKLMTYAAPGSWSQVISRQLADRRDQSKIVAVDLQEMAPIEGVTLVQGDITSSVVADKIVQLFDGQKAGLQSYLLSFTSMT